MRRVAPCVFLCVMLFVWPAAAQEQRGSIEGVVKDAQGAVLPGATVEARLTADTGAAVATANGRGEFRFPALPPGIYQVTASLVGFRALAYERVEVLLGQVKRVEFILQVAGLTEQVQVTGESPLVDVKQSARATSIRAEQVELLPKGRDFSTLVTQAAGANFEDKLGGISIDGASAAENRFIIDGVETTNLQTGASGQQLITDFVEEVQVKSSGYNAEYGGATGGVINAITKSGTNTVHGSGLFYWQGSALEAGRYPAIAGNYLDSGGGSAGPPPAAPQAAGGRPSLRLNPETNALEYIEYPEDDYYRVEPGFSIGGPIAKDKAWFFVAYQPTLINYERLVQLASGGTVHEAMDDTRHFFTANQTAQIGSKLRTRLTFNNSWRRRDGLLPALDSLDPPATNYDATRTWPVWSATGQVDWVARPDFYFGVRVGYYYSNLNDDRITEEPRFWFTPVGNVGFVGSNGVAVPPELQRGANFQSIPTNTKSEFDKQRRLQFQVDGTWHANFGGRHTFKGGVQVDNLGNDVLTGQSRNVVRLRWGQSLASGIDPMTGLPLTRGPFGYYQVTSNGVDPERGFITEGEASTTNIGLFFQDAWTINSRLTINAGIRTERERVPAYTTGPGIPEYGIEFDFKDKLAPRLGVAWDLTGSGKWKAYASWGIFYDIFKLELPRGAWGGDKWLEYFYTLDTPDWPTLVNKTDCPPDCSGTLIRGAIDFRHPSFGSDAIEPDVKPMKMQEAAVGVEHQFLPLMAVSVRYVHKQIDRAIEDTGSLDAQGNEIYIIANPGEGLTELAFLDPAVEMPKPKRTYDSVEFAFDKRYAGNWFLRASYMWSRLHGNYSGLSQGDENGRVSPNIGRLFDYPAMMFDESGRPVFGPLPTDRPHQFKTQVIYTLPLGTSVGVNCYLSSGVPVTRELGILPTSNFPVQYLGRNSDGRTDTFSQTDLYIQHEFRLGGERRLHVSLNVVNLFDQDAAISRWATYQLLNGVTFDEADFYAGRLDFDQLIREQGVTQDPRFLQNSFFQAPISARVGMKFIF